MADRRPPRPAPVLSLSISAATGRKFVPLLRRILPRAHALLRPPLRELSVALVGDRRMSQLHEVFMGIAGPTDVLTFPLEFDTRRRPTAGEVVICVPEARRRARQVADISIDPVAAEVLLYALHGMLHLCGFDDRTAREFKVMHKTEDRLLRQLGIGSVFEA